MIRTDVGGGDGWYPVAGDPGNGAGENGRRWTHQA